MKYRRFPNIGKDLSVLGFGCMRLPTSGGSRDIDVSRAKAMVRHAIDRGVNYIDTAWPYHGGQSEPFLGDALSDGYREKVYLATKLPCWKVDKREDFDWFIDEQLRLLNTEAIDFYMIHALSRERWETALNNGVIEFLDACRASGKVKHVGFSFHDDIESFKTIVDAYSWEFCLIQYNYLDTHVQAGTEGLAYAYDRGLGIAVMEPLRGGSLAADIPRDVQTVWEQAPVSRTPAEWALRWIWNDPRVTVVLSGMGSEAQLEENLAAAEAAEPDSLTAEELECIEAAKQVYHSKVQVPCTGCNYCLPCPHGVDIPTAFSIYNNAHMFEDIPEGKKRCSQFLSGKEASRCTECGTCEPQCPQGIPIIESLKQVSALLES